MLSPLTDTSLAAIVMIAFAAVLHASFQLGTSVLTLMTGHSFVRDKALKRVILLNISYIFGALATTIMLMTIATTALYLWLPFDQMLTFWVVLILLALFVSSTVITHYYRKGKGTQLWIPRTFANYLTSRSKKTKNGVEAAALGIVSVLAELPFTAVLILMSSLVLVSTFMVDQFTIMIVLYSIVASLPLVIVTTLIATGHRLSQIQRWREASKVFLQYAAGIGLFAAALYALVYFVLLQDKP